MNSMTDPSVLVELDQIRDNPYQQRQEEDTAAIAEIAVSIFRNGLLQVPSARRVNGRYELVFGHTRKAAYRLLSTKGIPEAEIQPDVKFNFMPLNIKDFDDRQMFELATVENIKRRDLKPTEKARAIQRYMEEFKASSKEAGELFGMNDATVRGLVRLLDLPDEVHAKLDDGTITQGTARALLSMQKIAPKETIIATVKKIETNKNNALPEDVIEAVIERLGDVVDMFDESRADGKPRSSFRNGWLLDMKNFPNELLPLLTQVDIAVALGVQDEKQMLKLIDAAFAGWSLSTTRKMIYSDLKRRLADRLDLVEKFEHLINPPACTACPFYTKVRGSHYCGIKICHTRKTVAWETNIVQDASRQLKIEIYEKTDGAYQVLSHGNHSLFNSRHKGLRLLPKNQWKSHNYQYGYTGVNTDVFVVVATGKAIEKLRRSNGGSGRSVGGKLTDKEKAERRAMRLYRHRRYELLWEYTTAAQSLFEGVPIEVLRKLCSWQHVGIDDRIPDEHDHPQTGTDAEKLEFQRRSLIWRLVVGETSHYTRSDLVTLLDRFYKITQVKVPKALTKRAQEWDAEIHELARVSTATAKAKGGD